MQRVVDPFLIRTSGGVVVGQTVQPVQAWKKGRYKLFDQLIDYQIDKPV